MDGRAGAGAWGAAGGVAVSPATTQPRRTSSDRPAASAAAATAARETPRDKNHANGQQRQQQRQHQQGQPQQQQQGQPQDEPNKEPSPPPRTPVRPPRTLFSASSFGRRGPPSSSSSSAAAAAASSAAGGKWRPSFGSGGGGRGGGQSPAGAMHAPWAAFSTPSRDRDGAVVPPSGSMGAGTIGSAASARRRRGGGAGNGPLGRLLQQVILFFRSCFVSGSFLFDLPLRASSRILERASRCCCVQEVRSKVCPHTAVSKQCSGRLRRLPPSVECSSGASESAGVHLFFRTMHTTGDTASASNVLLLKSSMTTFDSHFPSLFSGRLFYRRGPPTSRRCCFLWESHLLYEQHPAPRAPQFCFCLPTTLVAHDGPYRGWRCLLGLSPPSA